MADSRVSGTAAGTDDQRTLRRLRVVVDAQRDLLRARRPVDVVLALERVVHGLGGALVPADTPGDDVLPVDVALGVRAPVVPCAPAGDPAREDLEVVLPGLVDDAVGVLHRLLRVRERADAVLVDELTGALHRTATQRLLDRAAPTDVAVGIWCHDPDLVRRRHGPVRTEVLARQLGDLVNRELDVDERLGRVGTLTFVVLLPHPVPDRAPELTQRLRTRWDLECALPVSLRTAISPAGADAVSTLQSLHLPTDLLDDDRGPTT